MWSSTRSRVASSSAPSSESPGSGSAAIDPSIELGASASIPSAPATISRPLSASAWLAAMTPAQPPSPKASSAIQSIAVGSVRKPVGSLVPTQSNSWRKRVRPASGAFAATGTITQTVTSSGGGFATASTFTASSDGHGGTER